MALKEIMITLFENADGMTLSVTPNYSDGGKKINFSYKGASTHNSLKAYNDGIANIQDPRLREFFEANKQTFRSKVKGCVANDFDCWLSKGYLSQGHKGKGPTVPAVAFMVKGKGFYTLQLQLVNDWYECDLETQAISERQRESGAVAGHRWRQADLGDSYDTSFMGN